MVRWKHQNCFNFESDGQGMDHLKFQNYDNLEGQGMVHWKCQNCINFESGGQSMDHMKCQNYCDLEVAKVWGTESIRIVITFRVVAKVGALKASELL